VKIPAPRRHPSRRSVRLLEQKNPSSNSQTAGRERSVPLGTAASSSREHTLPISLSRSALIAQSNSPVEPIHPSEPSHSQIPNLQPQQLNQISTTATYAIPCPDSIEPPPQLRQPSLGQRNQDPPAVAHPSPYRLHSQSRLQTYTTAEQSYHDQSHQYTHVMGSQLQNTPSEDCSVAVHPAAYTVFSQSQPLKPPSGQINHDPSAAQRTVLPRSQLHDQGPTTSSQPAQQQNLSHHFDPTGPNDFSMRSAHSRSNQAMRHSQLQPQLPPVTQTSQDVQIFRDHPPTPLMSTSHGMRQNSPSNWSEQRIQQGQAGPSRLLNPPTLDTFPRFDPTSSTNHPGSSQLLATDSQLLPRNHRRQATPDPSSQRTLPYEPRRESSHVVPPSQPVDLSHSSPTPAANYPQQTSRASPKQPIPSRKPFHTMSPHEQREALQRLSPSQSSVSTAGQRSMSASPIPPASTPPNVR
jgi:hypothetical protein